MKRISMLCVLILLITKNVCASDLPATLSYLNIISNEDLHYITQEGNICCLKDSKTNTIYNSIADVFSSPLIDKGLFFNNVKAFAESYNLNQYYYIDMYGYLYQYNIDDDINQYRKIDGISNCEKVCCGSDFIIALTNDGSVWAWGENSFGQLGNGNYISNSIPSRIDTLSDIVDITAGNGYAFAIDSEGYVYRWGKQEILSENKKYDKIQYESLNIPKKLDVTKGFVRVDTSGNGITLLMKENGELYRCYNADVAISRVKEINKCIDMSMQPWSNYVYSPIVLSDDGSTWQWAFSSAIVDGWQTTEFTKTTYMDNLIKVVAGMKNAYIKNDGSVWFIKPDENEFWNLGEAICVIEADEKNKIKIDSIRFVKRSEAAERISSLYDELTGAAAADTESCTYSDVDTDSKYLSAIGKCCSLGLMNGTDENSFSPNKVLRREQLAVIIDRLLTLTGKDIEARAEKYTDDEVISEWAKESVYKTAELFDRKAGRCAPQEYVSYDELETIIEKVRGV